METAKHGIVKFHQSNKVTIIDNRLSTVLAHYMCNIVLPEHGHGKGEQGRLLISGMMCSTESDLIQPDSWDSISLRDGSLGTRLWPRGAECLSECRLSVTGSSKWRGPRISSDSRTCLRV